MRHAFIQAARAELDTACARFQRLADMDHTQGEYMKAVEEMVDADDEARRAGPRSPYTFRTKRNDNPPF